jgi:hypothetical protein
MSKLKRLKVELENSKDAAKVKIGALQEKINAERKTLYDQTWAIRDLRTAEKENKYQDFVARILPDPKLGLNNVVLNTKCYELREVIGMVKCQRYDLLCAEYKEIKAALTQLKAEAVSPLLEYFASIEARGRSIPRAASSMFKGVLPLEDTEE